MRLEWLCLHAFCLFLVVTGTCGQYFGDANDNTVDDNDEITIPDDGNDERYDQFGGFSPDDEKAKSLDEIILEATKEAHGFDSSDTTDSPDPKDKLIHIEYDMDFTQDELDERATNSSKDRRAAGILNGAQGGHRWKNNHIYYQFQSNTFTSYQKSEITEAMKAWAKYTCLTFSPARSGNRVYFVNGDRCSSRIGQVGGSQKLTLAPGCRKASVVVHELGHAIGLNHEQTRPDRDSYVSVLDYNIKEDFKHNFKIKTWKDIQNYGIYYDYLSIMHYGAKAFSKNTGMTIKTKDPKYQNIIGKRRRLSFRDIKSVNVMYQCQEASNCKLKHVDCPGVGFAGKDCKCWCPGDPYVLCKMNGNCEDLHKDCAGWARKYHCTNPTYKSYMALKCRKSCGLCNTNTCQDFNSNCVGWAKRNLCNDASYKKFMAIKCKKSCRLCGSTRTCKDDNKYCKQWADRGECQKSSKYMSVNCKKSCNVRNC